MLTEVRCWSTSIGWKCPSHVAVQKWLDVERVCVSFGVSAFGIDADGIMRESPIVPAPQPMCMPDVCVAQAQSEFRECFEGG
jgi:hypothetical protein